MSNKTVSRRFVELFAQQHDVEGCAPLFAANAVIHTNTAPMPMDFSGYKQVGYAFLGGFPDLTAEILSQVEERDQVVTHVQWRGTHSGEFNGIPATGNHFVSDGVTIDRIANDQIVERREIADLMGMMQQLGLVPA
jgi:steroid delta-isomerase-like uncharacterized protein